MDVILVLALAWLIETARRKGGAWYGGSTRSASAARAVSGWIGRQTSAAPRQTSPAPQTSGGRSSGLAGALGAVTGNGWARGSTLLDRWSTGAGKWAAGRARAYRAGWRVGKARARRGVGPWTGRPATPRPAAPRPAPPPSDPPAPPPSSTPPPTQPPPTDGTGGGGTSAPPRDVPAAEPDQPTRLRGTITVVRPDPPPPLALPPPSGGQTSLPAAGGDGATSGPPIAIPPPAAIAAGTSLEGTDTVAAPAPLVGRPTSLATRSGGGQPHTGGAGKGGGVAVAEFTLQDVLRLAAETRRLWTRAAEEMGAGEMGHQTVAACVMFAEAAAQFDRQMRQLHGGVWAAVNDAAVVGHSSRYLNR